MHTAEVLEEGSAADIARQMFDAYRQRDRAAGERLLQEDFELVPAMNRTGEYRGLDGVLRYIAETEADWEDYRFQLSELRDLGDVVLVFGRIYARGGGRVIDSPIGWVIELRDGRALRARGFLSHAEAEAEAAAAGGS